MFVYLSIYVFLSDETILYTERNVNLLYEI